MQYHKCKRGLTKKLDCFIPELESLIQFDVSVTKDYLELIASIEELSEFAMEWINKSEKYITVAMSEQLCKSLYDNGLHSCRLFKKTGYGNRWVN